MSTLTTQSTEFYPMHGTQLEAVELLVLDREALTDRLTRIADHRLEAIRRLLLQCRDATQAGRTIFRILPAKQPVTAEVFSSIIDAIAMECDDRNRQFMDAPASTGAQNLH